MVHSDSDLILHNSSVLIDKEPLFLLFIINTRTTIQFVKKHVDFLLRNLFTYRTFPYSVFAIQNQLGKGKEILFCSKRGGR
ncbi:hypothetical protein BTN88_12670 [Enterococcus faecium]|nr:hypothetical protein BTN88_12670 [Enterococcus faecium]